MLQSGIYLVNIRMHHIWQTC